MAKIPIILEAGRADGKLVTTNSIFDKNKSMFQSEINDIQDTLNSDNPNKPLSANQGKILKELLDAKVIEAGDVPIDTEPIEGNITHIVNSDGLAKEFNKCNTAIINTDRIKDDAVTSEKIATSAFDSTLSVSGKIAPADVVGRKLSELELKVNYVDKGTLYDSNNPVYGTYVGVAYKLPKYSITFHLELSEIAHSGSAINVRLVKSISPYSSALVRQFAVIPVTMDTYKADLEVTSADIEQAEYLMIYFVTIADGELFRSVCYAADSLAPLNLKQAVDEIPNKQDKLVVGINLDGEVRNGSSNPVTSDAVAQYLANVSGVIDKGTTYDTLTGSYVVAYYDIELLMENNLFLKVSEHTDDVPLLYKLTSSKSPYTSALVASIGQWKIDREISFVPKDQPTYEGRDINTAKYLAIHAPVNTQTSFKVELNYSDGDVLYGVGKVKETLTSINKNTNTDFSKLCKTIYSIPMISWVDDDGIYSGVETIRGVLDELGIKCTFAVIPPLSDIAYGTTTRADYFRMMQRNGHHITSHPSHDGWYDSSSYHYDLSLVEPSLIDCLVDLQTNGMLHSDMLVYPGSSDGNSQIRAIVEKWCECGVTSGYNKPNHLGDNTRWRIKRCFIDFTAHPLSWYKSMVDTCKSSGDWLIFGTHSYVFTQSEDTSSESINTTGNIKLLMQYVQSQNIGIYTLWDAYRKRKALFDFNEINR